MIDQLELLGGDLPVEFDGLRSVVTFGRRVGKTAALALAQAERAAWVRGRCDAYVAAIGTVRPRYSEARALWEQAAAIRAERYVPLERLREAEQLEAESELRRHRGWLAHLRAEAILVELSTLCTISPQIIHTENKAVSS